MDVKKYQRKINDVIQKCPIEAGVEILVYNFLDANINEDKCAIVDINRLRKNMDNRLTTSAGIPDIAVLSTDFEYAHEDIGEVYGFIEVKSTSTYLKETEQILGQMEDVNHFLYTNGIVWKYFCKGKGEWSVNLSVENIPYTIAPITIDKGKFVKLESKIKEIKWLKI